MSSEWGEVVMAVSACHHIASHRIGLEAIMRSEAVSLKLKPPPGLSCYLTQTVGHIANYYYGNGWSARADTSAHFFYKKRFQDVVRS